MLRSLSYPWSWAFVLLVSGLFQLFMPIASDEAYFIAWGKTLLPGVYDHPPLPGWVSYGLRAIGAWIGLEQHGVLHRLFSFGLGGLSLWLVARRIGAMGAAVGPALIVLALVPGTILMFNLYLNDTLLGFLALVFLLAVEQAFQAKRNVWVAVFLAALAFAAMLLTKYNGALVFLGMIVAFATWRRAWGFLFGRMVVISLIALVPFAAHLWWNAQNCSVNLAFNFGFRDAAAAGYGPLWLLLTIVFMAGPAGVLAMWYTPGAERVGFFSRVFLGTLVVMLGISIWRREFGINWGAPLGFMAVFALVEIRPQVFARARYAGLTLTALILVPLMALMMALQLNLIRLQDYRPDKVAHTADRILDLDNGDLIELLRPLADGRVLVAMDYGTGASFDNAGFEAVTVLSKSVFGRNQDLLTDFRQLDGRNMLLIPLGPRADVVLAEALFDSFEITTVKTARRSYQVVIGSGFSYENYRETWIMPVITNLYDKSPIPYRACYMDKYR